MAENYHLNHVRIPIGYWAFLSRPEDPYVQGQEEYLDKAIEWSRKAGLKVWIDLHGAPGSQNGFDNSGQRDVYYWQTGDNVQQTLQVIQYISQKYGSPEYNDVVTSIEILNEPLGPAYDMNQIKQFYLQAYDIIRNCSLARGVVFHDAFQPLQYWNQDNFFRLPDQYFAILDHHQYQVFSPPEVARSIEEHVGVACDIGRRTQGEWHWRVTGEWSAALTDCTKWLNGVGRGARYDGTFVSKEGEGSYYVGDCKNRWDFQTWSDEEKANTRKFVEAQLEAYDQGTGWIFWTYKTENAVEWDFRRLIDYGLFPFPFEDRHYPNICKFY